MLTGQRLVGARFLLPGAQCFAFLPILAQLSGFSFQALAALAQGLPERVDDLRPAARSVGMVNVWVAECRVRATMPSSSRARSWRC